MQHTPKDVWELPAIKSLRKEVNAFTANCLQRYTPAVEDTFFREEGVNKTDKIIYDPLLGNLEFSQAEVILLDSPIFQRLRQIKQLGFADLVFPSVTHSRFEHTLGVTDIAGRMALKIKCDLLAPEKKDMPNIVKVIRLAALFHDVGHMFSSHVSENFFNSIRYSRYHDKIHQTLKQFSKDVGLDKCPLSELISCLILVSPSVTNLLQILIPCWNIYKDNRASRANDLASTAACLILGLPINPEYLPYSKIISGDIDADKCDYLCRDSARTGIPVAIDINRIISKIRVVKENLENKTNVWTESQEAQTYNRVSIEYSARRCVDDIAFSRIAMFEKVYYHHKVCTAETMFLHALTCLDAGCPQVFETFEKILPLTDLDFRCDAVYEKWNSFVQQKGYTIISQSQFDQGLRILKRLSNRDLLYRCTVLNLNNIVKISDDDDDTTSFFREVIENTDNMTPQWEFLKSISQEATRIKKILATKHSTNQEQYEQSLLLLVRTPNITVSSTKPCFVEGGTPVSLDEMNTSSWHNSRLNTIQNHYIVCDIDSILPQYLAARKILYTKHNLLLTSAAYKTCRFSHETYSEAMKTLAAEKSYFQDAHGLYDIESVLSHRESDVRRMLMSLREYSGALEYTVFSPAQIYAFIGQFVPFVPENETIENVCNIILDILLNVKIFGRGDIVSSFQKAMEEFNKQNSTPLNQSRVHTLGSAKDSSQHISYYLNDLKELCPKILGMENVSSFLAITVETEPVVFFDDAFSTGVQLVSMFQELTGMPPEKRKTQEGHCTPLEQCMLDKFLERKIYILYCLGNENKVTIEEELRNLGLNATIIYGRNIDDFKIFSGVSEDVLNIFKYIGAKLLQDKKEKGWTDEKIETYSLGYNDAQLGIIYPWNTPSFTVTALWRAGRVDNMEWRPLFPRQSK